MGAAGFRDPLPAVSGRAPCTGVTGLGVANLAGAAFCCYPSTGGFSRSAVNADSGAKSGAPRPT